MISTLNAVFLGLAVGWITAPGDKSQAVRILDVLAIGPMMIYFGNKTKSSLLTAVGAATVSYNFRNYLWMEAQQWPTQF